MRSMFPQGGVGGVRGLVIRFAPVVFGTFFFAATAQGQVTLSDSAFGFQNEFEWCKKLGENRAWLTATTAFGANGVLQAPNDPVFAISPQSLTEPVDQNTAWAVPPPRVLGHPSEIQQPTHLQGSNVAVDKILLNAFISWASYAREPGFLEFRGAAGRAMRYGLHWYGNHQVVRESPVEVRETPLAHGLLAAPKTVGVPPNSYPIFFRLEHTGCRPKTVEVSVEYYSLPDRPSISRRSIPFRGEASGPQQSRIDIDSVELQKRFNGDLPQVLWISYNNERAFGMPLETRIELRGTPSPDRIDMSQKLCSFPINLDFVWDLPGSAAAGGHNTGPQTPVPYTVLDSGRVTSVGKMRIDIPLDMVRREAGVGPSNAEIDVVIRGTRDLQSSVLAGISLSLPIVNIPADPKDALPSGGCP
jgi:hypothetical protein